MSMYISHIPRTEMNIGDKKEVISTRVGDVIGSSALDIVYLVGNRKGSGKNTIFYNMGILISDGETGKIVNIDLRGIEGYKPRITLQHFKADKDNEILFSMEDIGTNAYITAQVFTLDGDKVIKIFDTNYYNQSESYQVIYQDNYVVDMVDTKKNIVYSIDISRKDKLYLSEIYNDNGLLKKKIIGKVLPVSGISPIDIRREDVLDLLLIQKIIGRSESDILAVMHSTLSFRNITFEKEDSFVGILGEKLPNPLIRSKEISNKSYINFSKIEFIESELVKDSSIERAIEKFFNLNHGEDKVNYLYNKVNLNDDANYHILVYLEGPRFCTERGGTLAIFKRKNDEYNLISKISNIVNPIIISENKSNGYRDLIVKVLDSEKEDFRVLKFNGNAYPLDPIKERKVKSGSEIRGIAAISDDLFYTRGIEYK
ncbi:hypothetical protein [Clostridium sp. C8]|uniref:hypothetical protein n=1 Tax=Clostridium sp. C8 TaxID=1667357 RepID=UPI00062E56EF|nr:hypothetical protein [Clostridium sp. C8]KLE16486.1 hypothetical protein AAT22_06540 [Clostridium sp. C8]